MAASCERRRRRLAPASNTRGRVAGAGFLDDAVDGGRTFRYAMTARKQLLRAIGDLTADEAADVLQFLSRSAQRGLQQARESQATSLDQLSSATG